MMYTNDHKFLLTKFSKPAFNILNKMNKKIDIKSRNIIKIIDVIFKINHQFEIQKSVKLFLKNSNINQRNNIQSH